MTRRLISYSGTLLAGFAMMCSISYSVPAYADDPERNAYFSVESFTWREFIGGEQFVKESGPIYAAGFSYVHVNQNITIKPTIELFGGTVDYNGYACDNVSCIAATSDVNYFGVKLEGDVGRRFTSAAKNFVEPFGGLGFRFWKRDIKNGTTAAGQPTAGYVEDWIVVQGRLGVRGGIAVRERKQIFAEAGIKLPIYNQNTAYVSDIGLGPDITLHPGKQVAYFAEAGIRISSFKGSLFYDTLRFPRSPTSTSGFFQPQSHMDAYGVKLGIVF